MKVVKTILDDEVDRRIRLLTDHPQVLEPISISGTDVIYPFVAEDWITPTDRFIKAWRQVEIRAGGHYVTGTEYHRYMNTIVKVPSCVGEMIAGPYFRYDPLTHGDLTLENTVYKDDNLKWIDPGNPRGLYAIEQDMAKLLMSFIGWERCKRKWPAIEGVEVTTSTPVIALLWCHLVRATRHTELHGEEQIRWLRYWIERVEEILEEVNGLYNIRLGRMSDRLVCTREELLSGSSRDAQPGHQSGGVRQRVRVVVPDYQGDASPILDC